ncbi:MAG: carbonic anhydrase family protein [Acidimicrobiales bacterium]|nr:carbonic anhydrase family protein [Acidimicrobiales bacterium]
MLEDENLAAGVAPAVAASAVPADDDETDRVAALIEGVQQIARRPETKFGAGGLLIGALATVAFLGSTLQPAGVQEARDDARLAIERLAIVQARLDRLDGGQKPAAAQVDHATPDTHGAAEPTPSHGGTDAHAAESTDTAKEDEHETPHWSYEGDTGPGKWAALANEFSACGAGKEQSPIDLARAEIEGALALEFHYASVAGSVIDNGHTIQVDVGEGSYVLVGERRFDLVQFHFHGPAEHTVGGRSYPLEVHFVHKDKTGKLAVVGVLVEAGGANSALSPVLDSLPTTVGRAETLGASLNPSRLIPKQHSSFQYSGSLTTPPCTEGVAWSVLVAPLTMSAAQLDTLRARLHGANNRPVQPLNDRSLFVDFDAN